MKVDLHIHTTASDGQYSPSEVVEMARNAGIQCMAVTDHDTVGALEEAAGAGARLGLSVLRGVEMSAKDDRNLHILGYAFSEEAPALREACQQMRESRDRRKYQIITFLEKKGLPLTLEEVENLSGGEIVGRPHFARAMLQRGYVSTVREAFERYLDTDEYRKKIERFKLDAGACIAAIRQGGGQAVLAHPWQLRYSDEKLEALVARLKALGLGGIECYYPRHTPEQVRFYLSLAERYHLGVTAGSDFHGELVKPGVRLTPVDLDASWLWEAPC